jgi:S-DNA-T family DNA segregation ATPase FtsK/SpoIIIE
MITGMERKRNRRTMAGQLGWAIGASARVLWSYRVELAVGGVSFAFFIFSFRVGWQVWLFNTVLVAALLLYQPTSRRLGGWLAHALHASQVRRLVERAAEDSGFSGLKASSVSLTLPGELVDVQVPRGQTVDKLDSAARSIAACLHVTDVHVVHDYDDRSHAQLSIIRRDPFKTMSEMSWPLLYADSVNLREPFPFGLDEYGREADVSLLSRNMLLGGSPDAGKSASLRIIAAAAALDPRARLWMMDAKTGGAEFVHWTSAAEEVVRGRDLEAAVRMLARLEERLELRGQEIVARGKVFVCEDMELDVLMIDELPQFTRSFENDTKEQASAVKAIKQSIWRLIALGRWAGMITVLSAQKPTADIVPSESRDLVTLRYALSCGTRQMSDAITGDGTGGETPVNAAEIPEGQPGVGYLLAGREPRKMRTYFISPEQALEVASRVATRHIDEELGALR